MLQPLVTQFNIVGNGFVMLKKIQLQYNKLKEQFKAIPTHLKNAVKKSKNVIGDLVKNFKNGAIKIGSFFDPVKRKFGKIFDKFSPVKRKFGIIFDDMKNKGESLRSTILRIGAALGGLALVKTGIANATELESTRVALENMKGKKRTDQLLRFGVNFANVTPYETDEVLDAIKKLELRGLDSTKFLKPIGNMAATLGKPLDQAIEAILDAATGEFIRLREFGVTKNMLETEISVGSFDNKGSLINQKKLFDDLVTYMSKRYKGGMESLATTTKGMFSTVKGIGASFMNLLLTGSMTGEIKTKSILGRIKNDILKPFADQLQKWQADGTFDRWADEFIEGANKVYNWTRNLIKILWEHRGVVKALAATYIAFKVAMTALNIVTMLTNPVGQATLAIYALVGAVAYMYTKFDWFEDYADGLISTIKSITFAIAPVFKLMMKWYDILYTFVAYVFKYAVIVAAETIKFLYGILAEIANAMWLAITNPIEFIKKAFESVLGIIKFIKDGIVDVIKGVGNLVDLPNSGKDTGNRAINTVATNPRIQQAQEFGLQQRQGAINNKSINNQVQININGGDTQKIKETIENVLYEKEIREGVR